MAGLTLGFGVGVRLGIVVLRWGLSRRQGLVFRLASGFDVGIGIEVWLGVVVWHLGLAQRQLIAGVWRRLDIEVRRRGTASGFGSASARCRGSASGSAMRFGYCHILTNSSVIDYGCNN